MTIIYKQLYNMQSSRIVSPPTSEVTSTNNGTEVLEIYCIQQYVEEGVRAIFDIEPFTCVHREVPFITISAWKLSNNQNELHVFQTDPIPYLHPMLQVVFHLTETKDSHILPTIFKYKFPRPLVHTDIQLSQILFISLEEFQSQFHWLCVRLNKPSSEIRLLLRLVLQWSTYIHSTFSNHRLGLVFLADLMTYVNHSCNPNCFIGCTPLDGWQVQLYSLRTIRAGEEITIAYTAGLMNMNRIQRQATIQSLCHFQCQCSVCRYNDDSDYGLEAFVKTVNIKSDIDYTKGLWKKCMEFEVKLCGARTSEERVQMGLIMLRYQWEYIKIMIESFQLELAIQDHTTDEIHKERWQRFVQILTETSR